MIDAQGIKALSKEFGIDELKITSAEPFAEALDHFQESYRFRDHQKKLPMNLIAAKNFYDVHSKLDQARSIIAAGQFYLTDEIEDHTQPGRPYGRIARYTWRNHYLDLKKRLKKFARYLKTNHYPAMHFCVYSNGPIAEKPIAERSGIGYYGKHSIIIHPRFGSWIVLGEIITNIELEPDKPLTLNCGECQHCIESCPTGAIARPYYLNHKRCIQHLSNWYGVIPDDIARVWGNRLYGCTTCQEVCPINKKVKPIKPRTEIGYVGSSLELTALLKMEEKDYRKNFARNQITASWINFKAIKRNALLCLGHLRDKKTKSLLQKFTENDDRVLAQTASWALNNF